MNRVEVVVPGDVDDPRRPSGGNVYDRRLCRELGATGWTVHEHAVPGRWPRPRPGDLAALRAVVAGLPAGAIVLVDGLVACCTPEVLLPHAERLRLVVLVHQLLVDALPARSAAATAVGEKEGAVLRAAEAVVVTSGWTRDRALHRHGLDPARLHLAEPGCDPSPLAAGTASGGRLLCVGVVAPHKGQDVLLAALERTDSSAWGCTFVGNLDHDRPFVGRLERRVAAAGLGPRVRFTGALTGPALAEHYARTDLLVVPSRAESYGMVAAEAMAHGIPALVSDVGGLPATIGRGNPAGPAGMVVPPGDARALASALHEWLTEPALRERLRDAAHHRGRHLSTWPATAGKIALALQGAPPAAPTALAPATTAARMERSDSAAEEPGQTTERSGSAAEELRP
ncbi:glycosyltransferase family 4 protein [Segeticoccus rhizosphaerae]|uniref:glycosyltransferase family 4 protein n=1 Tax=Segeticoccus rhizosphaerae TaxID=1104777 RepID=UPI0010C143E4|nr:glycosyltransferase family 4 protein [Ornithinicoccus soli]